jgi:CRISPR-associated protein Csb2
MGEALVVTVRFLGDAYHGTADWPPAPARLFQALVAGAARGRSIDEPDRMVLSWLERLPPPTIAAPVAVEVRTPTLFVPNNDLDAKGGDPARVAEVRVAKRTERRRIDHPAPLLYVYRLDAAPPPGLPDLVERLYRLGRGDDPAFATAEIIPATEADARLSAYPGLLHVPAGGGTVPFPVAGTLESLERRFAMTLGRFVATGRGRTAKTVFVQPPKAIFGRVGYDTPRRRLRFEILDGDRFAPVPLDRAGVLADSLRKQAAARLATATDAERLIVGRGATADDLPRRVVVLPVPSMGHAETDPSIRRVEVLVPAGCPIPLPDIAWAFGGLAPADLETGEVLPGTLVPSDDRTMGERYDGPARRWRSITPLALCPSRRRIDPAGGNPKSGAERLDEEEAAADAVRVALAQAGVRAVPTDVGVQREPFGRRETPAEAFAAGTRFGKHGLWHADVTFDRAVAGPLLAGDGRFCGLGLFRPVRDVPGGWALVGDGPLTDGDRLARAFRRAVMAQAREVTGSRDIPSFFSGHAANGEPLRPGGRAHVATVVDTARQRFLLLAPHLLDRRDPTAPERRHLAELATIAGRITTLVAGRHGVFRLLAVPLGEDDPLLGPARTWESLTPYVLTRHPRRTAAADLVAADVAAECRRRALPRPDVAILTERPGLAFSLRLTFERAMIGPLLLGRTSARGGLFAPVTE